MSGIVVRQRAHGVAVVTLDRPERRNALSQAMWRELGELFDAFSADDAVRAVILTGAGGHFSAGADISEFDEKRKDLESVNRYESDVAACECAIIDCRKPTVAAVRGYAMGGGCGLVVCCDFRVAHSSARFGIPAARLGIVYTIQECQALAAVVGVRHAKRILYTGEQVDAAEADAMGLVDLVTEEDPVEAAAGFVARMAENAPISIEGSKLALNAVALGRVAEAQAAHAAVVRRAAESVDYAEGRRAFMEKRRPNFIGR